MKNSYEPNCTDLDIRFFLHSSLGLDPYSPRYDQISMSDHSTPRKAPLKPKQAFVDNAGYEDDLYEEPVLYPSGLPQTAFVAPDVSQPEIAPQVLIPTPHARRLVGRNPVMARPTSATQRPGPTSSRRARPSSARTEPLPLYASPTGHSYPNPPPGVPVNPRQLYGIRPSSAASSQVTPRYTGFGPGGDEEPPTSFDQARAVLSRAQSQLDRIQRGMEDKVPDETDGPVGVDSLYAKPLKTFESEPTVRMTRLPARPKSPRKMNQTEVAAMERAELEAQLLVSQALARARIKKRT